LTDEVKECLQYVDHVLPDLKQANPEKHKELTGMNNEHTMNFIRYLDKQKKTYWIRYVIVPGWTDTEADVRLL